MDKRGVNAYPVSYAQHLAVLVVVGLVVLVVVFGLLTGNWIYGLSTGE